ncbi:MAG: lamin tail domain-containing protein [Chloroflexota bacterium]
MHKRTYLLLFIFIFLFTACAEDAPTPTPEVATAVPTTPAENTPPPAATTAPAPLSDGVVISEVLIGVPGGNNYEFIELYNGGETAVSLAGWSLWYASKAGQDPEQLITWDNSAAVPPFGHYLLIHEEQDFGLIPDATFALSLSNKQGGLLLRDANDNVIDAFGWGETVPDGFFTGAPIPVPESGDSLERLPGGSTGNGQNSGDNTADFQANAAPNPQNSGSALTPAVTNKLELLLEAPEVVEPGAEFSYLITVGNTMDTAARDVVVTIPIPDYFTVVSLPSGFSSEEGAIVWQISDLPAASEMDADVKLQSPYTYVDTLVNGYYADAAGLIRSYGSPQLITMAGGAVPIAIARDMVGSVVGIEGVATMYTDGFFAGTTGTKFYMEDDSGGIQVYIPGGMGVVNVAIGDNVHVTGKIELYRDSLEIIPVTIPDDVLVLDSGEPLLPAPITVLDNETDDAIIGRLTTLAGTVTRVEEFSFSYELDIADDQGNMTLVYIEKETGVSAEPIDLGEQYRITGISEFYSGLRQIKPRLQSDIERIYPPIVWVEMRSANNVQPGNPLTYTITVYNYTETAVTNLTILAPIPNNLPDVQPDTNGLVASGSVTWQIAEIPGAGGSAIVTYVLSVPDDATDFLQAPAVTVTADSLPEPLTSDEFITFIGEGVPIWAIQGSGDRSPYVRSDATTTGIVSGVFPDLHGFFIQETETDDNPATSAGLFVLYGNASDAVGTLPVAVGDLVQLTGRVRELSGQTTLNVTNPDALIIHSSDNPLPPATVIDPPQETAAAAIYNETLEGMLVTLGETAVAAAPVTQYGEYVLVYDRWGVETVPRGAETGFFIIVDDGSSIVHESQETLPTPIAVGDQISDLTGPLAFTYDQFKIEPIVTPTVIMAERPLPSLPPIADNELRIATFNTENFFDNSDPHPSSPPLPTRDEYEHKLAKLADAIVHMGAPQIIGLQEVENIDVLADLAATEALASFNYQPYLIEGYDSRGIDVGYLVRTDVVTISGFTAYPEPNGLMSRPPLVITATVQGPSGPLTFYVLNNHFLSLSAGEEATEATRTAQAAWNVTIMDEIRAAHPDALFVVMGDLNSFYETPPLTTLQASGLHHVYEFLPDEERPYTYIFEGATQTLDHILLSPELFDAVTAVTALHIDANYPLPSTDDASAKHVSDHDPLIVSIELK